jgi:hypothetical protein
MVRSGSAIQQMIHSGDEPKMDEININGKTLPVYTETNLEGMSRDTLKKRGLDLKDLLQSMGAGNVCVPRHPEPLREWILATQQALLGKGSLPAGIGGGQSPPRGPPPGGGGFPGEGPGFPAPPKPAYEPSESAMTEAESAYMSSRASAAANRQKQMGATNILTWGD